MKLSVVIPTRNEADNIATCLGAFADFRDRVELIVVDNSSSDATLDLAAAAGARTFVQGPERCAQRNRGWHEAHGEYVMFVDADMIVPSATIAEILANCETGGPALYVREVRSGSGLRLKARNFERSFYDGTCIDGLRVIRRDWLERAGGYDEELIACEDWDLDRRLLANGVPTAITCGHLIHNEARQNLKRFLAKKAYYSQSVGRYRTKWHDDQVCRRQFGLAYRYFGVFTEKGKWKRLMAHPILAVVMYFERVLVGLTYLRYNLSA